MRGGGGREGGVRGGGGREGGEEEEWVWELEPDEQQLMGEN